MNELWYQEQYNHVVCLLLGSPAVDCVMLCCAEWDYSLALSWLPPSLHVPQMIQEKNVQFRLELPREKCQIHRDNS